MYDSRLIWREPVPTHAISALHWWLRWTRWTQRTCYCRTLCTYEWRQNVNCSCRPTSVSVSKQLYAFRCELLIKLINILVLNNSLVICKHFCLHRPTRQRRLWERMFKSALYKWKWNEMKRKFKSALYKWTYLLVWHRQDKTRQREVTDMHDSLQNAVLTNSNMVISDTETE